MLAVKKWVIQSMCHERVARIIYRLFADRIPSRGFKIDPGGTHVSWHAVPRLFWGLYEKAEINFVRNYLRPELDVVELGASLGVVSLHIAQRQAPDRLLVCVEANPELIPVIRRNLDRNLTKRRLEIVNVAVADGETTHVEFEVAADPLESHLERTSNGVPCSATTQSANAMDGARRTCRVPAARLSHLLQQYGIDRYALVCDIEGAEASIFLHDAESLQGCQQIVLETHPNLYGAWGCTRQELNARLVELGFARKQVRGPVEYWERVTMCFA
jgi:FkbM family methyltransferase